MGTPVLRWNHHCTDKVHHMTCLSSHQNYLSLCFIDLFTNDHLGFFTLGLTVLVVDGDAVVMDATCMTHLSLDSAAVYTVNNL